MPQIVSIILALALVFVIASAHYLFTQLWHLGEVQQVISKTQNNLLGPPENPNTKIAQWIEPIINNPEGVIDTVIISGPKNNEIITDSNQVTFKFRARVYSEAIGNKILFETKISGIDSGWQETRSNSRTFQLDPGTKKYTFSVRAKSGGFIDSTPAIRTFTAQVSY